MILKPKELRKFVAPEILFGSGAIESVSFYVQNLGGGHVLLVSDPGVQEAGWLGKVEKNLEDAGISYTTYTDITPNPKDYEVKLGVETYIENNCSMIVAIGGGSPIDCAKGIGIIISNGGDITEYEGVDRITVPMPPLICIPTTAGASADVSQFAIITNSREKYKIAIVSKGIVPDISIIDPDTTVTMDGSLTAETGLDALTHSIEAFVSTGSSPLTDLYARQAIIDIVQNLPKAVFEPENPDARSAMMLGSLYAGLAFSNASLGLVHSMAHALGGYIGLPHGLCNALLLEHVVAYNFSASPERYRKIAKYVSGGNMDNESDGTVAQHLNEALRELRKELKIDDRLEDGIISKSALTNLVGIALNDACIVTNPRVPSEEDVLRIYEAII